jgi:hypothetical protein
MVPICLESLEPPGFKQALQQGEQIKNIMHPFDILFNIYDDIQTPF